MKGRLLCVDVNTGKNVGTYNLEETVFETMEAAKEIAIQLRLRNLSGDNNNRFY